MDGDNFILETRVKNDIRENPCQTLYLYIICAEGVAYLPLTTPGCVSTLRLKYSDYYADGKSNDLSVFGCDLSDWIDLRCEVKNKEVKIFINQNLKHQLVYSRPLEKIVGIAYNFKGCGAVDFIKLSDQTGKIVYEDNFTP